MTSWFNTFIVRSLIVHLLFFSLFVVVVPYSQGGAKPQLSFLGAILSRHELLSPASMSKSLGYQKKSAFTYEAPSVVKKWQVKRAVEKPLYRAISDEPKPAYKEKQVIIRVSPKKPSATLEEIGVSLEAMPSLQLKINP